MNTKFALKTTAGALVRAIVLAPFVGVLLYTGEYATFVDNIATFMLVVLALGSALYLIIMTLVPPEYAIKTDISVLEFNMWLPQIIAVHTMGVVALVLCIALASQAMYVSAAILFLYSLSNFLWPRYAKRIDLESKEHMVSKLTA
jgi:hypothetical protein